MLNVRVLIVDDNEDNLDLMQDLLEAEGFTVLRANNGPQAVQMAHVKAPDVILLDLMMPHMDGLAVFEMLRTDPRSEHIPCILNTAYHDRGNLTEAIRVGFKHVLCKPLDRVRLITEINKCLAEARSAVGATEADAMRAPRPRSSPQSEDALLRLAASSFDHIADLDTAISGTTVLGKKLMEAANGNQGEGQFPVRSVPGAIIRLGVQACREIIRQHAKEAGGDPKSLESLVSAMSPLVVELREANDPETALLERLRQIEDEFVSSSDTRK